MGGIDLGGFAKGHAVDNAVAILGGLGIRHAFVSAGGDSRVIGDKRGRPWTIGGSIRCFCSWVPNTTTGFSPKILMCTAEAPDMPAPDSAMACITMAAVSMPRPDPPCSAGRVMAV